MNRPPAFQVNDKVVVKPEFAEVVCTVPQVVPGRVYCVERINIMYDNQWLRLVGVREHKLKCCDDRGAPACLFRLAGRAGSNAKKGGA